jgi:predicted ATPase/DNA-binding winged helix-turn-helix (wHTH) protein
MIYAFADCVLDTHFYTVVRARQSLPLRPKVFQLLHYLLEHRDHIISRDELCAQVWPEQFISDATLDSTLREVRRVIGDSGHGQQMIQTLRGHGYRFVAAVQVHESVEEGRPGLPLALTAYAQNRAIAAPDSLQADAAGGALPSRESPPLVGAPSEPPVERKVVTVLCCALAVPPLQSSPPGLDTLYDRMHTLHALAQKEGERYGGRLLPVMGDHVLVVFGAPVAQEDHAQRAVLAALALQRRVSARGATPGEAHGEAMTVRIGLHTGPVMVRDATDPEMSGALIGEMLRPVMALQEQAMPGSILCSDATARLVEEVAICKAGRAVVVAGQPTPIGCYTVLGRRVPRRLLVLRRRRVWTPLVGRTRELGFLHAALRKAKEGQGQVVGLAGEPGIGKSRLVYEFYRRLQRSPVTYLAGGCFSHGSTSRYLPLLAMLRQNCGIIEGDQHAAVAVKVYESLQELGMAPELWAPYLFQLLEMSAEPDLLSTLSPQTVKARTVEALVQMALQGAKRRPLVLEVENLHWIDPSSEEFLAALVERLPGARIMLLLTYRPGYRPPWIDKSYATQLALGRLAPRQSRRVVEANLRLKPVPAAVVQAIVARADGNPLFLEELAHAVAEQENASRLVVVPDTVHAVLSARIDRLPPPEKRLLQMAAVIGRDIPVPLLEAVLGVPETAIEPNLAHLQALELFYETTSVSDRTMTFKHALVQEAAYQSLPQRTRQRYHQRIAAVLAAQFPETVEMQPERLAYHYTEAALHEDAIAYWMRAGQRAAERSAHVDAISHLTKGLEELTNLPATPEWTQQELAFQIALGRSFMVTKGFAAPEVERAYGRARELCQQVGQTPQLFAVLRGLWRVYGVRAEFHTAHELGEQLLHLAQQTQDPELLMEAHLALGNALFWRGDFVSARARLERVNALYDPLQHRSHTFLYGLDPGVVGLSYAAQVLWLLGYPDQALRWNHKALTLAHELGHPHTLAHALGFAASLYQFRRDAQAVREQVKAMLALSSAQEFPQWVAWGAILHGWVLAEQGHRAEGMAQMRQGLAAFDDIGAALGRPYWLALLAEALGKARQAEEGLRLLAEALVAIHNSGEHRWEAEIYRLKGQLLLALAAKHDNETEACFHHALNIARRQEAKSLELRAAMSLSRLWQHQGKREEARELLAPIYGWFTEGFDTADLREAKALLEALS